MTLMHHRFSIFLGLGIVSLAWFFLPQYVLAASLSISPANQSVAVGQTFVATVAVTSLDQAMNAVSGDLSFPADKLNVVSVSRANSIVTLWVQNPAFSNTADGGDVSFQGIALSPGFTGTDGDVIKVTFRAVAPGDAPITFNSGSVLANDGSGTNILTSMSGAAYTVASPSAIATPLPVIVGVSRP